MLLLSRLITEHGPSFEQIEIILYGGCFVPSLIEIGPVVLEKKTTMWKVYNNNNNNGQNYDQKSSLELKWVKYQVIFYNFVSTYLSWLHIWNLASNLAVDKSSSPLGSFLCVCSGYLPENLQYLKIQ